VIAQLIASEYDGDLAATVQHALGQLDGFFAFVAMALDELTSWLVRVVSARWSSAAAPTSRSLPLPSQPSSPTHARRS